MNLIPPNLPSPAPTPDNSSQGGLHPQHQSQDVIRVEVEQRLLRVSQDLYELEICAGDVVAGQEDRVPMFLQNINEHLVILNDLSRRMTDSVPRQVVENVDQFRNPHSYTKNALSRATGENQYALGRILGLESFRRQLGDALSKEFPTIPLPPRRHQSTHHAGDGRGDQGGILNGEVARHGDGGSGEAVGNGSTADGNGDVAVKVEAGVGNGAGQGLETVREGEEVPSVLPSEPSTERMNGTQ